MRFFIPREVRSRDTRAALLPDTVGKLVRLGAEVTFEPGLGAGCHLTNKAYTAAGGQPLPRGQGLSEADLILRINKPPADEIFLLKRGAIHISFLDPFREPDLVRALAGAGVSAMSLELIPRTTLAQKMDALSSQSSLAGYVAVLMAAGRLPKIFPMMMTPAGTLAPALVFVIGAGVAGLQAIATARRLGARVEAFDTRPVVEEQVKSLGARFVKVDLGETGQTKDGYAKALTGEQMRKQREAMAKHCAQADVVITTAQVFGRKAPLIVTADMVRGMKPGSVIVDMAVESGGNVEGSRLDEEADVGGVKILGHGNLPGRVPLHASQMISSNLGHLVEHGWDAKAGAFTLRLDDEILRGCLVTHGGEIVNEMVKQRMK
ncbi:MAG: NAD(P) transhydrogenase subunit alpha [Verrucomicrobia bacterium]|nr:NAD(P) transhydrogenase subunit alpha [Verrucomicrobiota bacterium]